MIEVLYKRKGSKYWEHLIWRETIEEADKDIEWNKKNAEKISSGTTYKRVGRVEGNKNEDGKTKGKVRTIKRDSVSGRFIK